MNQKRNLLGIGALMATAPLMAQYSPDAVYEKKGMTVVTYHLSAT